MASSPKLGIFGGTFDPVHWGHLIMAEQALEQFSLDQVLWLPAQYPPHKTASQSRSYHHRVAMLHLAIADHPQFHLCEIFTPEQEPSYAIHHLQWLQKNYPTAQWFWIIGQDALLRVSRWYRHQEIAAHCEWLVAPRSQPELDQGQTLDDLATASQIPAYLRWHLLDTPWIDLSSRQIRQRSAQGRSIRYLVPTDVERYIQKHHLYCSVKQ